MDLLLLKEAAVDPVHTELQNIIHLLGAIIYTWPQLASKVS